MAQPMLPVSRFRAGRLAGSNPLRHASSTVVCKEVYGRRANSQVGNYPSGWISKRYAEPDRRPTTFVAMPNPGLCRIDDVAATPVWDWKPRDAA